MTGRRAMWPIRWWLATFGAAVALPFIILLAVMFASEIRNERLAARTTALRIARPAATRLTASRNDSTALLQHMATRPAIQNFDSQPCDSLFAIVDFFPQYVNLFLFDRNAQLVCSAKPQSLHDQDLSNAAQTWLQEDLRSGRFEPGKLMIRQN